MDIAGTKKRIQRLIKVAEESYKRINKLQTDLESTSSQVDHIGYELAEQRVLLEALAEREGIDVETLLAEADLPPKPDTEAGSESDDDGQGKKDRSEQATSRPSADGGT